MKVFFFLHSCHGIIFTCLVWAASAARARTDQHVVLLVPEKRRNTYHEKIKTKCEASLPSNCLRIHVKNLLIVLLINSLDLELLSHVDYLRK